MDTKKEESLKDLRERAVSLDIELAALSNRIWYAPSVKERTELEKRYTEMKKERARLEDALESRRAENG